MLVRGQDTSFAYLGIPKLVHRLAYNGDVARRSPGQLAVFQGGPSRTGLPTAHFECNDVTIICETVH